MAEAWPPDTWFSLKARALYQANRLSNMAERSSGRLLLIRSRSDLEKHLAATNSGSRAVAAILAIEGAHALEGNLDNLDTLFEAGVRMVAPTHFFDTDLAGSSSGLTQAGLTEKGQEFVRRAEAKHIVIDLAHASEATIRDVTDIASRPVVVSHTGIKAMCGNNRNLSDESVRRVARTDGVIGIGYWKTAVCGTDAAAIARSIKWAIQIAGVEHVALGSDFDGATAMPFDASGLGLITDALLKQGLTQSEIRAVMGGNVIRVLRKTLPD
jgi:microsomal dipeptidase-like Zn-dependent dipeptidase